MHTTQNKLTTYLTSKGFNPSIQKIIKINSYILCILLCISCIALTETLWFLWVFCGALLTFFNFFFMASFVQKMLYSNKLNIKQPRSFLIKQIFLSNFRLFISGILLYSLLVLLRADPFALLIGLTIPLAVIPIAVLRNS